VNSKIFTVVTVRFLPQSFWFGLRYVCPSCSLSAILRLRSKFTFTIQTASSVLRSEVNVLVHRRLQPSGTRGRVQLLLYRRNLTRDAEFSHLRSSVVSNEGSTVLRCGRGTRKVEGKGKGTVHHITGHEGPEGE
jgi:hypothetical protein